MRLVPESKAGLGEVHQPAKAHRQLRSSRLGHSGAPLVREQPSACAAASASLPSASFLPSCSRRIPRDAHQMAIHGSRISVSCRRPRPALGKLGKGPRKLAGSRAGPPSRTPIACRRSISRSQRRRCGFEGARSAASVLLMAAPAGTDRRPSGSSAISISRSAAHRPSSSSSGTTLVERRTSNPIACRQDRLHSSVVIMRCLLTAHDTQESLPVPPQGPSLRQKNRSPQLFCKRLSYIENFLLSNVPHGWLLAN